MRVNAKRLRVAVSEQLLITEFVKQDSPFCLTRVITRTMIGPSYTPLSFSSEDLERVHIRSTDSVAGDAERLLSLLRGISLIQRCRGRLALKARKLWYHPTLDMRVIKRETAIARLRRRGGRWTMKKSSSLSSQWSTPTP